VMTRPLLGAVLAFFGLPRDLMSFTGDRKIDPTTSR
jgi:hypothetical protein